jgi:hypothetical protein
MRIHAELNEMLRRYVKRIPDGWILTQTHAILNQRRGGHFKSPLDLALAVTLVSWRLSLQLNRTISARLALSTLRTLSAGIAKTAIGLPVVLPEE